MRGFATGCRNYLASARLPRPAACAMFGVSISMDVHPEGEPERRHEHVASLDVISDDYFRVMRIPQLSGRSFTSGDRDGATRVAIVSESIVSRYFAGHAIGKRIIIPEFKFNIDGGEDIPTEIVGVVGNVCVRSVEDCQAEHIYLAERQNALRMEHLLVRTEGDPLAVAKAVRRAAYLEAPAVPLDNPQTLEDRTSYLTDGPKRAMWLMGVFAGLALLLAAVGIYGVSSYMATQRSREIGIRMALGAEFRDIAGLVFRGILLPSAVGLAIGMGAAVWLTRLLKSLLFGVNAGDPKTLVVAGFTLLGISVLAATGPALRAGLSDPAKVLRRE